MFFLSKHVEAEGLESVYGVVDPIEEPINKNKFEIADTKFLILILLPIIFIIGCITYYKKSKSPSKAKILRIIILGVLMVIILFL
jgi:hypothetical protein